MHAIVESGRDEKLRPLLATLPSLADGRIVCDIPPFTRRLEGLQDALLEALGKSRSVTGIFRSAERKAQRTRAWLCGEQVRDLIVSSCEELLPGPFSQLLELAAALGIRLWVIAENEAVIRRRLARAPRVSWLVADEFLAHWHAAPTAQIENASTSFPDLPEEDFALFLDSARRTLQPRQFATVREAWTRGLHLAETALPRNGYRDPATTFATLIRAAVADADGTDEAICVLRGIQTALFLDGRWHLSLELPRFVAANAIADRRALETVGAQVLRRYVGSERAAAAVIACAARATPAEIALLRVADVSRDGMTVTVDGRAVGIPRKVAGITRTQRTLRVLDSAKTSAPLLIAESSTSPRPAEARHIQTWLRDVTLETGFSATLASAPRRTLAPTEWLRLHGMKIHAL